MLILQIEIIKISICEKILCVWLRERENSERAGTQSNRKLLKVLLITSIRYFTLYLNLLSFRLVKKLSSSLIPTESQVINLKKKKWFDCSTEKRVSRLEIDIFELFNCKSDLCASKRPQTLELRVIYFNRKV